MKDWSNKIFTYTIINQEGVMIGQIRDYLINLENFALKSDVVISSIERKGKDDFNVYVHCKRGWKI
jgi:sporulation protein YlmC with PRC-barrel domain